MTVRGAPDAPRIDDVDVPNINRINLDTPTNINRLEGSSVDGAPRDINININPDSTTSRVSDPDGSSFLKNNKRKLQAAGVLATGAGLLYWKKKNDEKVSEDREACANMCIPKCWECNTYPGEGEKCTGSNEESCDVCIKEDGSCEPTQDKTLAMVRAANDGELPSKIGGKSWDKQPFCKNDEHGDQCYDWCMTECKELHPTLEDKATNFFKNPIDFLKNLLKFPEWAVWLVICVVVLFVFGLLYSVFSSKR